MKICSCIIFLITVIFFPITYAFSQAPDTTSNHHTKQIIKRPATRNLIWFTPTKANKINGIAIGTIPSSVIYNNDSLQISGIHFEANPIMLFLIPYVVIGSIMAPFIKTNKIDSSQRLLIDFPDSSQHISNNTIHGLNISILGSGEMSNYNGASISSVATIGKSLKGVSITAGANNFYEFHGVLIAGLMNNVSKGNGLQIALFNRCKECKGI
jgi:hypothetical protein